MEQRQPLGWDGSQVVDDSRDRSPLAEPHTLKNRAPEAGDRAITATDDAVDRSRPADGALLHSGELTKL